MELVNNNNRSREVYKIEIQCSWNVKTKAIPVITAATETISKKFRIYLCSTLEKHESRNYRKQPYWAPHTHLGKYKSKNTEH
jgi:hypothetical protein